MKNQNNTLCGPTSVEWLMYTLNEDIPRSLASRDELERELSTWWHLNHSHTTGLVAGYVYNDQQALKRHTPAEWDFLRKSYAVARAVSMGVAFERTVLPKILGVGEAQQFLEWIHKVDPPLPNTALTQQWCPDSFESAVAVITSTSTYVVGLPAYEDQLKIAAGVWRLLDKCCLLGFMELVLPCVDLLMRSSLAEHGHSNEDLIQAAKTVMDFLLCP